MNRRITMPNNRNSTHDVMYECSLACIFCRRRQYTADRQSPAVISQLDISGTGLWPVWITVLSARVTGQRPCHWGKGQGGDKAGQSHALLVPFSSWLWSCGFRQHGP